jgi:nitrite reductase/ring-hydroxylating ferredoxin subunit
VSRAAVDVEGLEPGGMRVVTAGELQLLVCNVDGELFAFENRCPHQDYRLSDGRLRGHLIECSLHGGRFDVRDGCPTRAPTRESLVTYHVQIVDGRAEIEL